MAELMGPPIEAMGSEAVKSEALLKKPLSEKMEKSGFGHILKTADKVRKRKAKSKEKPSEKNAIDVAAERLATTATKIDIERNGDGESVKIQMDPSKMTRDDLGKIFPQTVLRASVVKDMPDGGIEISDSRTIFRHVIAGKVVFLVPGPYGEPVEYALPKDGKLVIDIPHRYQDGKSPAEVLALLKNESVRGTKEKLATHSSEVGEGLLKPGPAEVVPIPSPRSATGGSRGFSSPEISPNSFSVDNLPETVSGNLKIKEKVIPAGESPTGMPLYVSSSEVLKNKPVRFVTVFPGDGGYIGNTAKIGSTVQSEVEKMRRAGENVVLVIPEPKKGIKAKRWNYFHESKVNGRSPFDNMKSRLGDDFGVGEHSFISYSGGYRAINSILASSEDSSVIKNISMLDSLFAGNIAKRMAKWVANGGKLFARSSKSSDKHGRKTMRGTAAFKAELSKLTKAKVEVKGSFDFKQMRTAYGGTVRANMLNALAFSAGMSKEQVVAQGKRLAVRAPSSIEATPDGQADALLSRVLLSSLSSAPKKNMRKGKCNYYSMDMMNYIYTKVLAMAKPIFENANGRGSNYISNAPMASSATADVRGKRVKYLSESDFANFRPGQAIHMNAAYKFAGQNAATPGTSHKLPSSNKFQRTTKGAPWRHWVTVVSTSPLRFSDNKMRLFSLSKFKQTYGGKQRVMVNVYDPLASVRRGMVAYNGQLNFNGRRLA